MEALRRVAAETGAVLITAVQNKVCCMRCAKHAACLVVVNEYSHSSQCSWTVVHFAAYNGHLEMLRELLERFNCEADKRDKKVGLFADKWCPC